MASTGPPSLQRKHLLKLALPYRIRPILIAFALLSGGVQLHQLFGYLFDGPSYLCLCLIPLCAAQFIELRLFCIGSAYFWIPSSLVAGR